MDQDWQKDPALATARGLEILEGLVMGSPGMDAEWQQAWGGFSQEPIAYEKAQEGGSSASGRFREWFLLERHSPTLMGTPMDRLIDAWRSSHGELEEHVEPLLQASFTGIFEVGEVVPEQGAWLRDISGFGEYALRDPLCAVQMQAGDLLVGRLFPLAGSVHHASGHAVWFRSEELTQALMRDLGEARKSRRAIIRIGAPQLEMMFFAPELPTSIPKAKPVDREAALAKARTFLVQAGLPVDAIDQVFQSMSQNPMAQHQLTSMPGDPVGKTLELLAFETEADLTAARALLTTAWQAFSLPAHRTADAHRPQSKKGPAKKVHPKEEAEEPDGPRAAVERFQAARSVGGDLELDFARLEEELGLAPDAPEVDDEPVPDFPGVVGAMVEEFRWDVGRKGVDIHQRALEPFAEFTRSIGLFEDLSRRDIVSFATFWVCEKNVFEDADQATETIEALEGFCRWAQEEHSLPLEADLTGLMQGLRENLPRISTLNRHWRNSNQGEEDPGQLFALKDPSQPQKAALVDKEGNAYTAQLPAELCAQLKPGDHLRARIDLTGHAEILCLYPPEASELYASK